MKNKFYFLIFLAFFAGTLKAQTINKIKLDSLTEIVALQQKFKLEGIKSKDWQQSTFDIGNLISNKKKENINCNSKFFKYESMVCFLL